MNDKIVFLGDSITEGFKQLSVHNNIVNLGISGDRTIDVIERLELVHEEVPNKLFLMIGINDIMTNNQIWFNDHPIDIDRTYTFIVNYLIKHVSKTKLYLLSVLPISRTGNIVADNEVEINKEINRFNHIIKLIADKNTLTYIDLHHDFLEQDRMKFEYTTDGIHLSTLGYQMFYKKIKKYL